MRPLIVAIFTSACATSPAPQHAAAPSLTDAIARARAAAQPLVVEFGAPWCAPCRTFARHVLTDPAVQDVLRTTTFVQYEVGTPIGDQAADRCGVTGVPMIVALDPRDGGVAATFADRAPTVAEFLDFVARAPH